jgi:CBS domain-containing protein
MESSVDAGLIEIARFLAMRAPFDALAPEDLRDLVAETQLEFYPAGALILSEDGGPVTSLRVIHSGGVDITHDGQLLDLLGPGDTLGHQAMLSGLPPGFDARAQEDTLCYLIPVAVARPLLDRAQSRELRAGLHEPGHQPVATLIRSPTVRCEPMQSIRDVARRMTDAGANAAVVNLREGRFGIVTDRDIRTKVVAKGLPITAPVATAMTSEVFAVTPGVLGGEVLFEMLERGIGHVPIVSERGELIGVVEDADLVAVQPRSWFGVRRSIARARTVDELATVAGRLPEIVANLHAANLRASEVARVLSALTDAITIRSLELASIGARLEPDGLVWVAVGSQARREMTPASRPGGAIVYSEPPPSEWIDAVRSALRRCDLIGEVMARTAGKWAAPRNEDELALTVLVERRALWGTPREPLPTMDGGDRDWTLAALARRALAYAPPTGFDADAVLEADGTRSDRLDIRRAAVIPIVELGRWAGAAAGAVDGSTPERLQRAAAARVLSDSDVRTLTDAFELALDLRIGHHMTQLAAGHKPDDSIDIVAISPLMRDHLRDVFRAVSSVQRGLRG